MALSMTQVNDTMYPKLQTVAVSITKLEVSETTTLSTTHRWLEKEQHKHAHISMNNDCYHWLQCFLHTKDHTNTHPIVGATISV
jgi:hypothetical protein